MRLEAESIAQRGWWMTIARGVAVAALALAIVLVAVLLLRGGATHQYDLRVPERRPARQGRRRAGRRPPHRLDPRDHADRRQPARVRSRSRSPTRRCARARRPSIRLTSLSGIANRYIALTPAPNSAKELDDGATLPVGSTTDVVDLDQLFNTLDPDDAQGPPGRHPGLRRAVPGQGRAGGRVGRVLQPVPVDLAPARQPAHRGRGHADRLHRQLLARGHRRRRAPRRPRRPRRQHQRDGGRDRLGERRARPRARAAADDAAAGQHDVREPARDARRPRRAGRRVQARDEGPRPVPARAAPARRAPRGPRSTTCARLVTRSGADNDLLDATRKLPELQQVASPTFAHSTAGAAEEPAGARVHPPLHAPSSTGWFHDFGQATANYDANGHFARIQPIFNAFSFTDNPARRRAAPAGPQRRSSPACRPTSPSAARAPPASAPQDGSAPWTDDGNLGPDDCDPSLALPGP